MRIAYVEDDLSNVALVERVAQLAGDTLTTFSSAEEAAANIYWGDVDLVLTDIDFGENMSGLELTEILRERGLDVPIIAITAYDLQEYIRWAERAGNDEFIVKPVSVPQLIDLLDAYRPG